MLKILHTADWHLGKKLQEYSRIEEQKLVLEEITAIADKQNVDLVLLAGDIFDTFNPSHEAVELLYKTLRKLSKNGDRPIIAISGNHDSTQFVEAPDPLAREMGIFFYGKFDTLIPLKKLDSGVEISASDSGFVELRLPKFNFPIRLILAPYANEVSLRTHLGEGDRESEFRKLMGDKWKQIADQYCDDSGVNLFVGHFFFTKKGSKPESEPESERPILHVGGTQALYTENIPSQIQYAALGHLHRFHAVDRERAPVVYSSSPLAYSFSEADQEKKVVLINATPGQTVGYEDITLKAGRPLYRKRFETLSETLDWLKENPYCFVELTFVVEESIEASTRKAIMSAHDGIVSLIPELKSNCKTNAEAMRVEDLSQDINALFGKYYESQKGTPPNEELMGIFQEVIASQKNS